MLQRLHEDPTGQTAEPEMCEDVDQNVDPEQSEAADDIGEPSIQEADNTERIENSPEIIQELTRVVKKDNFLKTIISIGVNKDLGWSKRWSKGV